MQFTWNDPGKPKIQLEPLEGHWTCPVCRQRTAPRQLEGASTELLTCSECGERTPRRFWRHPT